MTALTIILISILLTTATVRMISGHWMPVHSEHILLNFAALTIADIPVEELGLDPDEINDEKWHMTSYAMGAYWRLGLLAGRPINPFTITGP